MADYMIFPETVEEFIEKYKFKDDKEIYTNGADLIPVFRIKQWMYHHMTPPADVAEVRHGTWIGEPSVTISANTCDFCKSNSARLHGDLLSVGYGVYIHIRFCPMCGRCIV
ncbi:MAG: hypothetical protein ACI4JR_09560 [Acutalibacteraceae bacterium]